jgi:hypothetical protein
MVWLPEARLGAALNVELLQSGACGADRLAFVETTSDFRISVTHGAAPALHNDGIPDVEYEKIVAGSVRRQRMLAYRYALRNSYRYPKAILLELVLRTIRNKLLAVMRRSDT